MLACTAQYADLWNAYYDDTHNKPEGIQRLRPLVDAACAQAGRDPATLTRTTTVLIADATTDPWWDRLPTENWVENGPLKPLAGAPEHIAEGLLAFRNEGIAHLQICLEPTTCGTIEALARVLEIIDEGDRAKPAPPP
jgi:alkanesulfonate monooxygenase SsuD/methylene tetrahydromethanopterin reductase-like flavin-dependent oxidoreductase (luciferase family)